MDGGRCRIDGSVRHVWYLFLVVFLFLPYRGFASHDVIVLKGGDTLHGEIKKLEKKILYVDADYADEIFQIKWEKVVSIRSDRRFAVETFSGALLSGNVREAESQANDTAVVVASDSESTSVDLVNISSLAPVDDTVLSRFDGSLSGGSSFTKASSASQFNVGTNVDYRSDRNHVQQSVDVILNTQGGGEQQLRTSRWESNSQYRRYINDNWFAVGVVNFLKSTEQELDLRRTVQGGLGRYILRSPSHYLVAAGGLAWTNERYESSTAEPLDSGEAWAGVDFYTERLRVADYYLRYAVFPSLTRAGRYRMTVNSYLKFNLPGDWDFKVSFYDNFDSQPVVDSPRNDYGIVTSFGWNP
jgi:hypothetical protein